jgi:deoxyguanosine kinase
VATATGRFVKADQPLIIAVEGVIGVGKTTLVKALAERLGAVRLSEDDIANPFLERFYKHGARWALACQTCFLEGRLRQFANKVPVGVPVVSDHSLHKEPIFAEVNLDGDELALYRRLFEILEPSCAFKPSVVVYLSASINEVRQRIRSRNRAYEGAIDVTYLDRLVQGYQAWFDRIGETRQRVVVVDADGVNVAQDPEAVDRLLEACLQAPHGVSFCNLVI